MGTNPRRLRKKLLDRMVVAPEKFDMFSERASNVEAHISAIKQGRARQNLNLRLASVVLDHQDESPVKHSKFTLKETPAMVNVREEQRLQNVHRDKPVSGELSNLEASSCDNMHKSAIVRAIFQGGQEQNMHDPGVESSSEIKERNEIEIGLRETKRRLENLSAENSHLTSALLAKEKLVAELQKRTSQAESEFDALLARLDSTEKENAFLKYEHHVLEKELEVRKEEMEYNRRSVDLAHKQHLKSVNKIVELEAECQKLRLLVRKHQVTPTSAPRRRKTGSARELVSRRPGTENPLGISSSKRLNIDSLMDLIRDVQEENEALRRTIANMDSGRRSSSLISSQTRSRLWQKDHLREDPIGRHCDGQSSIFSCDICDEEDFRSFRPWENAMTVSERFGDEKVKKSVGRRFSGVSEMSLLDDFVEMEKLAIVSSKKSQLKDKGEDEKPFDWLQVVLDAIVKQQRISKRSMGDLLDDIKIALGCWNGQKADLLEHEFDSLHVGGYNTGSFDEGSSVGRSVCRIIELIEGLNVACQSSLSSSDYFIHVFQWKKSEAKAVLDRFILICDGILNGKSDLKKFSVEVSFLLDWMLNNYASPEDSSNARDKIKKHFGLSKLESSEGEVGAKKSPCQDPQQSSGEAGESDELIVKLAESEQKIGDLQKELETLKESKDAVEDQMENQKSINEDLDTQLTVTKARFSELIQKLSSLEVELEYKSSCCEELEATCLELQLQLESVAKDPPMHPKDPEARESQNGWEMNAASVKLAECQETIQNLRKQLRSLSEKALSSEIAERKKLNKRATLRDQMLFESISKRDSEAEEGSLENMPLPSDNCNALVVYAPQACAVSKIQKKSKVAVTALRSKKQQGLRLILRKLLPWRTSEKSLALVKV